MAVIGEAFIAVRPDSSGFGAETEKGVLGSVTSIAKKAALILGGAFVFRELARGITSVSTEFAESAKIGRLSEAVIKSTGAAANVTAAQMSDLANAIAAKTGIDDEAVQSAENVLATFTSVKNEVGDGNDIFNQATLAIADMSAALGTDLQGSTIQLGKALNDPIKGITALTRVGVSFTQGQKDLITSLVESGDVLGAQKVILAELTKEFGGAAEAAADPLARLKVIIGNAKEQIGSAVVPLVSTVANALATALPDLGKTIADAITNSHLDAAIGPLASQLIGALGAIVAGLAPGISAIVAALAPLFATIATIATAIAPAIGPIGSAIGVVIGAVATVANALAPLLGPIVQLVGLLASTFAEALFPALLAFTQAVTPIVQGLLPPLNALLEQLAPILRDIGARFGAQAVTLFASLGSVLEKLLPVVATILGVLGDVAETLFTALAPVFPVIQSVIEQFAAALGPVLQTVADTLTALAPSLPPLVAAFAELAVAVNTAVLQVFADVLTALLDAIRPVIPFIGQLAGLLAGVLTTAAKTLAPVLGEVVRAIGTGLVTVLKALAPSLPDLAKSVILIVEAMASLLTAVLPILPPLLRFATLLLKEIGVPTLVFLASTIGDLAKVTAVWAAALAVIADGVAGIINAGLPDVIQGFKDFLLALGEGEVAIATFFGELPDKIVGFLSDIGQTLVDAGSDLIGGLLSGIETGVTTVFDFYVGLPVRVVTTLGSLAGTLVGAGVELMGSLLTGVTSGIEGVLSFFGEIPGRVAGFGFSLLLAGAGLGKSIVDGIAGALGDVATVVENLLKGALNAAIDGLNGVIRLLNSFQVHIHEDIPFAPDIDFDFDGLNLPEIKKLAKGGTFSGLGLVGERGPELLDLGNLNASVFPTDRLMAALGKANGVGQQPPQQIDQSLTIGQLTVPVVSTPDQAGMNTVRELQGASFRSGR